MFPICLMGVEYTQGIGFGYKTLIPCYQMKDLYQRLLWLLGVRKRKPIISPITDCEILSSPEVLESLLTTGSAKIDVQGIIDVSYIKNSLFLKSWPPGKRFESLLNKFSSELDSGMIGFTDLSVHSTNIQFQVLRERNRDKIFQDFLEKMKDAIKGTISFETTVVDINQKVLVKSIDQMLLDTFNMFTGVNNEMLKREISKANDKITELELLEKIRPQLSDCIKMSLTLEQTLDTFDKLTDITSDSVKEIVNKYRISKLLTLSTDTSELVDIKNNLENKIKNLNDFVLEQYNGI